MPGHSSAVVAARLGGVVRMQPRSARARPKTLEGVPAASSRRTPFPKTRKDQRCEATGATRGNSVGLPMRKRLWSETPRAGGPLRVEPPDLRGLGDALDPDDEGRDAHVDPVGLHRFVDVIERRLHD